MLPLRHLFIRSLGVAACLAGLLGVSCAHPPVPSTREASRPKAPPAPVVEEREFDTHTPFVLSGGLDDLPAVPEAQVRAFAGEVEFRRFCDENRLNVWPVGRFAAGARPRDPAGFEQVLRSQAAAIGADYVVVMTLPAEIQQAFRLPTDHLSYGAMAYRRVTARIGVNFSPEGPPPQVLRVTGFVPGSQAEADGIRLGDVIETVDDVTAQPDNDQYWKKALRWQPGQQIRVKLVRDGTPQELVVTLAGN